MVFSSIDLLRISQASLAQPRIKRWEDLCANEESVRRMRELYRSIDEVDTMVGLFAETPPAGFGFSDTAFRIFILMASRRLQSDRFLTVDFRPEVYSPFGMDWVAQNGMTSLILRHCPDLAAVLPRDAERVRAVAARSRRPSAGGPRHEHDDDRSHAGLEALWSGRCSSRSGAGGRTASAAAARSTPAR